MREIGDFRCLYSLEDAVRSHGNYLQVTAVEVYLNYLCNYLDSDLIGPMPSIQCANWWRWAWRL